MRSDSFHYFYKFTLNCVIKIKYIIHTHTDTTTMLFFIFFIWYLNLFYGFIIKRYSNYLIQGKLKQIESNKSFLQQYSLMNQINTFTNDLVTVS